jgi:hypothetical protein
LKKRKKFCQSTLLQPFLVKMQIPTNEEFEGLYQLALAKMLSNDFCVVWYYLSAWGEKSGM